MLRIALLCLCVLSLVAMASPALAANRIVLEKVGPARGDLYISKANGSGEHRLTKSDSLNYDPSWSPKGDWIVFTSEREGPADLYRIHPDGSGLEQLTRDHVYDDQAAFSPDEKKIVFVSSRGTGRADLWILNLATHKATRLTKNASGGDFRPSWSPNGKWIAFSSDRGSSFPFAKGRWERLQQTSLYVIHPDGTGLRRITKGGGFCGSPKWTADSRSVVAYCMSAQDTWTYRFGIENGEDRLEKIKVANDKATDIAAGPGVKLEPTMLRSGEIAYLRFDKTAHGVFYGKGKPGPSGMDVRNPSWSPDGRNVVYSRLIGQKVPLLKLWSRNKNFELYGTGDLPEYDRSGTQLAVTINHRDRQTGAQRSTLFVKDGDQPLHAILKRNDLILAPHWSPNGKRIVVGVGNFTRFLSNEAGGKKPVSSADGGAQVAIVNADGSNFHFVTSGRNNNAFASFSPDGKEIVYRTEGPDGIGLRILNLKTHAVKVLTHGWDDFPQWSPRGHLIAFTRKVDGNFNIFTIHPDGTGLRQLTHTRGNDAHAAWSGDGKWLVFTSSRRGFKDEVLLDDAPQPYGEIFVMRADGSHVMQLTDDQWEEGGPCWRP